MELLIFGIYAFIILILITAFINIKLSVSLYVALLILVPYWNLPIGSTTLGVNFVNTIILVGFFYYSRMKNKQPISIQFSLPFLFLFFSLLFIGLFGDLYFSIQFGMWRVKFMAVLIISFVIWNLGMNDKSFHKYMIWTLLFSFLIAGIYSLYLRNLGGLNPYTTYLSMYFDKVDFATRMNVDTNRLVTSLSNADRIQSTTSHPMNWAFLVNLFIAFLYILFIKGKRSIKLPIMLLLLTFSLILFLTGVRTGVASLIIAALYYLLASKSFKSIIIGGLLALSGYFIITTNTELTHYFSSFIDIKGTKSDIAGSSIQMRLSQLEGAFNEISNNPLCGHGFDWTGYYIGENINVHPVLYQFESLIFTIICNSGYIGVVIWILFFLLLVNLNRKILRSRENIILINTLIVIYVAYSIGTGEYLYQQYFSIFYSFLLSYLYQLEKNGKKKSTSNCILFASISSDSRE